MDFLYSDEQQALQNAVDAFSQAKLASGALKRAHADRYPWDVARALGEQGLLGLTIPTEKGGHGASLVDAVIAIQSVAAWCPKSADVIQAGNFGAVRTFAEYASPRQRTDILPGLLSGETLMGLAMTEPEAGSAITELSTTAAPHRDGFVLNGTKIFSTHSADANMFLVYARFGSGTGGIGSVLVDRETDGLSIGQPNVFMNGDRWCSLYFDDCYIPAEAVLLGPGGFKKQIAGFNVERIGNAARSIALGRYAFERAKNHAVTRSQFGRALCDFQGLQWMFAEAATKLESAQLLLLRAATSETAGIPGAYDSALAKFAANQAGFEAANMAVQVMGGAGFGQDELVEYCFRRTRGWMIAGGSMEMLKNRIAESIFDRRFDQRRT